MRLCASKRKLFWLAQNAVSNPIRLGAATMIFSSAFIAAPVHAQMINCNNRLVTPLSFQSPSLISGTALQTGAIYRFDDVTSGVDAIVEVLGFTGGATLNSIDRDVGLVEFF